MSILRSVRQRAALLLAAAGLAMAPAAAQAHVGIYFGLGGYPAPYVYAPPPVQYYAPPVYYAPPDYYAAPPAYYYGPPPREWHRHWRDRDDDDWGR
jgi:hypothetical protein